MTKRLRIPAETIALQAKASDPRNSVWVSANAGSGKTHVLAQRVMRLLLDGTEPSRILCLTYTKAAAANMSNRVFTSLSAWATMPDTELIGTIAAIEGQPPSAQKLTRARRLFARALETPGGLKIQTIHAFCEAILHQFTLEANIAGHFEMLDPAMEEALIGEARRAMIAAAADGSDPRLADAFELVLETGEEHGLAALLSEIVRKRDPLRAFIAAMGEGDDRFAPLFEAFELPAHANAETIAGAVWPDSYFDRGLAQAIAAKAAAAGKKQAAEFAATLSDLCGRRDIAELLPELRGAFLTFKKGVWTPKSVTRIMSKGVAEHFPQFEEEFARFAAAVEIACDRLAIFEMLEGTRAALTIADWLIGRYERLKSGRGFLDFNDLISRTVNLLARQDASAWVHYKLDQGIDHILLDEAQDTSPDQWRVVKSLAQEFFAGEGQRETVRRTIFAVGDEKQSIYSFQGAEPQAFLEYRHAFGREAAAAGESFEAVRLHQSFRSTHDLLSAVDLVFARAEVRQGLTGDPEDILHGTVRDDAPGYVELWPSLGPEAVDEPDDWTQSIDHAAAPAVRLAGRIAATIDHWTRTGERIEGTGKRLTAGDVMVLVRKRDSFVHALSRELKRRHVPVAGADRLILTDHIAVRDLMAVGRFALQPDDDLSLAAALKSPIFGIDEETLLDLAARRPRERSLFASLKAKAPGAPLLERAVELLGKWRNGAGFKSAFIFYSGMLARDGVRRAMVARLGHEAGDILDEFLNFCLAAERSGSSDLEAVLALLDGGGPQVKRELDQARGEVRIMTAHAAKGLEAPVVFLVDSGGAPFHDSHLPVLMPFDPPDGAWPGKGLLWRSGGGMANSVLRGLTTVARRKAEEEYRRLLYVGMTRAEDRLIVCGYHGASGQKEMSWHAIVHDALEPSERSFEQPHEVFDETVLRYRSSDLPAAAPADAARFEAVATPMPEALTRPVERRPALPRPLSPSGAAAIVEPFPEAVGGGSPVLDAQRAPSFSAERGTAIHRLLQMLPSVPPAERQAAAMRYLERAGATWPAGERDALLASSARILDDTRFAAVFQPGSRAEVGIMGTIRLGDSERAVSGKIDRLAVSDDEVLIVDYKSNRPPPASIDEVPPGHIAQLALYRALLAPLYPSRTIRAGLLYTESPTLIALPAEAMDAALVRLTRA